MRKYVLSSSILAADFSKLGQEVLETVQAGAEYIHVDIMDGHFVPSLSLGFPVMKSIRPVTDKVFDVHLMISNPQDYIEQFAKDGADIITIHLETTKQPEVLLSRIKELGCKAGLAINPETPVEAIKPYLSIPDMVLVMTVHPGFGGQKYIDECTEKVVEVRKLLDEVNPDADLEVDGGVCMENLEMVMDAGANIIVMGSAVFRGDARENTQKYVACMKKRNH